MSQKVYGLYTCEYFDIYGWPLTLSNIHTYCYPGGDKTKRIYIFVGVDRYLLFRLLIQSDLHDGS